MKRKLTLIALAALIAITCAALIACEPRSRNVGPAGVYNFYSVTGTLDDEKKVTIKAGVPTTVNGTQITINADAITLTLENDGSLAMHGEVDGEELDESGTWERRNDGKILLTIDNQTVEATLRGGILSFAMDPVEISFKYVKAVSAGNGDIGGIGGIGGLIPNGITGMYKFYSMTIADSTTTITIQAGKPANINGISITIDADSITMDVRADNTFVMKGSLMGETFNQDGTWEQKNGKYYFTANGDTMEVTLKNGILTLKDNETETSFKYYGKSTSSGSSLLNSPVGTYKFSSMKLTAANISLVISEGEETDIFGNKITLNKDDFVLVLKKDKTFKLSAALMGSGENLSGTWEQKGNGILLTSENDTISCTIKNGVLTMPYDSGTEITFKFFSSSTSGN